VTAYAIFFNGGKGAKVSPGIFQSFMGVFKAMEFPIPGPLCTPVIKEVVVEQGPPNQFLKMCPKSQPMGNKKGMIGNGNRVIRNACIVMNNVPKTLKLTA
jgi:hypothetical protein